MASERSRRTSRDQLVAVLGGPAQRVFDAGLRVLSLAESQANRIAPTAAALSTVLQTAVRQTARDPLGMAKALASAAAAGAGMALDRAGTVVEPRMTRVLNALQIPTAADLKGLARRVEELNASVQHLAASRHPPAKTRTRRNPPARKRAAAAKSADRS